MSMREFLDGNCGQLNPVLKVASHFTQDVSFRESLGSGSGIAVAAAAAAAAAYSSGSSRTSASEFLQENHQEVSMLPPTTFRMTDLLQEIHSIDQPWESQPPVQGARITDFTGQPDWAEEFIKNEQNFHVDAEPWAREYFSTELDDGLDPIWEQSRDGLNSNSGISQVYPAQPNAYDTDTLHLQPDMRTNWIASQNPQNLAERTELMISADELLRTVSDPNIKATEFMNFVEKLSRGENTNNAASAKQEAEVSQQWADEYDFQFGTDTSAEWVESFAGQVDLGPGPSSSITANTDSKEDFWNKLQGEWERLSREEASTHPWLTESKTELTQPYAFNESNPFQEMLNPLEEGKRRLQEGDIPSAVLAFEAAVQQSPENPECWFLLGSTQAQNEQDPLAISALNKCISLDQNNLTALMTLAASLTNESYQLQACNALKTWLTNNPKYSYLMPDEDSRQIGGPKPSSVLPMDELSKVQKAFIKAAQLNPKFGVDADVQSGLGILFNLSSDYDRAADCFQAAVGATPNDSLLWNRLGATLANGGKSPEAIGAYRKALQISPGFIRTRYNLGISCVNLGAYREAAEHFLSALNQQAAGKPSTTPNSSSKSSVVSDSIWSSLRMILHLMDRPDLSPAIDSRDLARLNKEFSCSDFGNQN